jgi:hypothetical protein
VIERYALAIDGIKALQGIEQLPDAIILAAQQAVNKTTDRARAAASRDIRLQVNFPASYLADSAGRLSVIKRASRGDLTSIIQGTDRPTSLARFSTGSPGRGRSVSVQVKPGQTEVLKRAFLIRLRSGTADLDTRSNLGLAIRLKPGERIQNKRAMIQLAGNLYLLYGPSVSQVFSGVAQDISPDMADFLDAEFNRLMELAA